MCFFLRKTSWLIPRNRLVIWRRRATGRRVWFFSPIMPVRRVRQYSSNELSVSTRYALWNYCWVRSIWFYYCYFIFVIFILKYLFWILSFFDCHLSESNILGSVQYLSWSEISHSGGRDLLRAVEILSRCARLHGDACSLCRSQTRGRERQECWGVRC
jgi:hypothetical protein